MQCAASSPTSQGISTDAKFLQRSGTAWSRVLAHGCRTHFLLGWVSSRVRMRTHRGGARDHRLSFIFLPGSSSRHMTSITSPTLTCSHCSVQGPSCGGLRQQRYHTTLQSALDLQERTSTHAVQLKSWSFDP